MSDCNHSPTVQLWAMTNDGLCPRCLASDYDALRAEVERLESENDRLRQDRSDALEARLNEFCERRDLKAEIERLRGALTQVRADVIGYIGRVPARKYAIWRAIERIDAALGTADQPDAVSTNSPKVSSGLVDAQPDGFCTKCNGPIYLHRCAADNAAAQPEAVPAITSGSASMSACGCYSWDDGHGNRGERKCAMHFTADNSSGTDE